MMSEWMSPAIDLFQIKSSQEDISYNYLSKAHVYLSYRQIQSDQRAYSLCTIITISYVFISFLKPS